MTTPSIRCTVNATHELVPDGSVRLVNVLVEVDPDGYNYPQAFEVWVPGELTDIGEIEQAATQRMLEDLEALVAMLRAAIAARRVL